MILLTGLCCVNWLKKNVGNLVEKLKLFWIIHSNVFCPARHYLLHRAEFILLPKNSGNEWPYILCEIAIELNVWWSVHQKQKKVKKNAKKEFHNKHLTKRTQRTYHTDWHTFIMLFIPIHNYVRKKIKSTTKTKTSLMTPFVYAMWFS